MEFDEKVKEQLIIRGFAKEQLLNNRGLIGATINETVVMLVKKSPIPDVILQSEQLWLDCQDKTATHRMLE